mgnify:CR=1 FL=1
MAVGVTFPDPYALIDLETTGANPVIDRITEIAILRFEGGELVGRLETLVNPARPIPDYIQRLIGITDDMVAGAPRFEALADSVRAILEGAVFVAHNARFDYGFIRNEYARLSQSFDAPVLCTVKLSRALFPEHHRHGLDALIARHGLTCDARHRAMGDVEVLRQFLDMARTRFNAKALSTACERAMKLAPRPRTLPEGVLEGLPDAAGVYVFFGDGDAPLYVGRSPSLRARVLEHFAASDRAGKQAELADKTRRVEWHETAGELSAMLLEAELLASLRPTHNRLAQGDDDVFGLKVVVRRRRPPSLQRIPLAGSDPLGWADVHGTFRNRKESDHVLRELAAAYMLCPRRLGIESAGSGPCQAYRNKRCAGVCAGRESPEAHDDRLLGALKSISLKPWPWPGAVAFVEHSEHAQRSAWHVFDRWCHLGTASDASGFEALCANLPPRRFDLDRYRMMQRWLANPDHLALAMPLRVANGSLPTRGDFVDGSECGAQT